MARKSLLATLLGVLALAVPSAFADKGGVPHEGSNGQGRPADQAQTRTHGKALAKGHAKTQTQATPKVNTHANAGKTTICHATGSAKNPYVRITISNNAVPAHQRHQDGRDIIPAPAEGCPTTAAGRQQQQQETTPGTTGQEQAAAASTSGSSTPSGSSASPNNVSVLGASTSGSAPSASRSPAATATRSSSSSGLPFTGTDAMIVAILGLAALLLGVTVRRATTNRA